MSPRDHTRSCPSCERELSGREHSGEGGLTVIWKCVCGWGSARTVPAVSPPAAHAAPGKNAGAVDVRIRKASGVQARPVEDPAPEAERDARGKARESDG